MNVGSRKFSSDMYKKTVNWNNLNTKKSGDLTRTGFCHVNTFHMSLERHTHFLDKVKSILILMDHDICFQGLWKKEIICRY